MTLCRMIAPPWLLEEQPDRPRVIEGEFTTDQIRVYNEVGYNVYCLPNAPKSYQKGVTVDGTHIDNFQYVFTDFDLKSNVYPSKEAFLEAVEASQIPPSKIVDSGNGIHVYWRVQDLDAKSYLRFQRRFVRLLRTDEATTSIFQLMRLPGTINTKLKDFPKDCVLLLDVPGAYTSEELDRLLPAISTKDEEACNQHYDRTYNLDRNSIQIMETMPPKWGKLLRENGEVKELWAGATDDRSMNDFRLGQVMNAHNFTPEEAITVLANSAKALRRAPIHRLAYAQNIVEKIWTYEAAPEEEKATIIEDDTVRGILSKGEETILGERFPCHRLIDDTVHGFRLGQVVGIIGGSGVGKTTLTLNAFLWFAENNPNYHHFFFSLEQPVGEIAMRIKTICQGNDSLYDRIHVVSNYGPDGKFRDFSMTGVEEHLLSFQKRTGHKIGATVIDHIGVLKKPTKQSEGEALIGVCKQMKSVAVTVNTLIIMLSQSSREKAGIGDLELNKDAAYGTVKFEAYCDYCICLWQPLKRVYTSGAPTVMAFKFAKIRHKRQDKDRIREDVCYQVYFDPQTERLRELTREEERKIPFYLNQAANIRKQDRKTDVGTYVSRRETEVKDETVTDGSQNPARH